MKTTMDMSSYEIEQDIVDVEYGEEILSAGWNPAVQLVCEQLQDVPTHEHVSLAADFSKLDSVDDFSTAISDMFLSKMYSFQR